MARLLNKHFSKSIKSIPKLVNNVILQALLSICLFVIPALLKAGNDDVSAYRAEIINITNGATEYNLCAPKITLKLKNIGTETWDSSSKLGPVFISYHLLDKNNKIIKFDNIRTPLSKPVPPNDTGTIQLKLEKYLPGEYILEIDLVVEGKTWFGQQGSNALMVPINYANPIDKITSSKVDFNSINLLLKPTWWIGNEKELSQTSGLIDNTSDCNKKEFFIDGKKIITFTAGDSYLQSWIRDLSTAMPYVRHILTKDQLIDIITQHLVFQGIDGSINDNFDQLGNVDKNTVESDQESSLINAAYSISQLIGFDWLKTPVKGLPIFIRLEKALLYLFAQRFDQTTSLIKSGHTADWGDVTDEFSDQRSVRLQPSSKEVASIYTNSMAYIASLNLSRMFSQLGLRDSYLAWKERANNLGKSINQYLWNNELGFYKVHIHLGWENHKTFKEDIIFGMGGNAVAIEAGLASPLQTQKIFSTAIERERIFNISTISGSLLPTYPKGFFKHPALDDFFEYQNGGQWDWFGGRLINQMFKFDHPGALDKLREIAVKVTLNGGFFEWDTVEGKGMGSFNYTGGAAVIGNAVINGFFGIEYNSDTVFISPKLGNNNGFIFVPSVCCDEHIAYSYAARGEKSREIQIELNVKTGRKIILPRCINDICFKRIEQEVIKVKYSIQDDKIEFETGNKDYSAKVYYSQ